jgi:hypothetical protein
MNHQNYLPLHLSKLVHAKVPNTDTGMWWLQYENYSPVVANKNAKGTWDIAHCFAYRLDDLMHACNHLVIEGGGDMGMVMTECDRLLIAYLSDNLRLDGKNVEEFITKTFV